MRVKLSVWCPHVMLLRIGEFRENRGRKGRPFETTVNQIALTLVPQNQTFLKRRSSVAVNSPRHAAAPLPYCSVRQSLQTSSRAHRASYCLPTSLFPALLQPELEADL